jgi:hypothetical protein
MNSREFVDLLQKAIAKENSAIYEIIQEYEKLIYKYSRVNGRYNEDCKAYIELKIVRAFKKSKFNKFLSGL